MSIPGDLEKPLNDSMKRSMESDIKPIRNEQSIVEEVEEQQEEEELLENSSAEHSKTLKTLTRIQLVSTICIIIGIIFAFALPPFIHNMIISQAIDQAIMQPSNEKRWAHFPGDSKAQITRNFTFFNVTNAEEILLFGQKPVFKEIQGYKITEIEDYLNITYLDDGNKVKVKDWLRFGLRDDSRNLSQKVKILNMGALGYWYGLKTAHPTKIIQQGLALIFTNLQASIVPTLLAQGLSTQYLTNYSVAKSSIYTPAGISQQNSKFLWNDASYGMNSDDNLGFWVTAVQNCYSGLQFQSYSNEIYNLRNYFGLSYSEIDTILKKLKDDIESLKMILLQNHYCDDISMDKCTGRYLAVAQMAQSFATLNIPPIPDLVANDTICQLNVTCAGKFPQISAFYKRIYQKSFEEKDGDIKLTFKKQTVLKWFDYNNSVNPNLDYNTRKNCLLHVGNLEYLWQMGTSYDQTKDDKYIFWLRDRFELETYKHTLVFWEWIKYIYQDLTRQSQGSNQKLGVSTTFVEGFYGEFSELVDELQPFLLAKMITKDLQTTECHIFFEQNLDQKLNNTLITNICNSYGNDIHNDIFSNDMIQICDKKFGQKWNKINALGASAVHLEQLCDIDANEGDFGKMLHNNKKSLDSQYDCSITPTPYCSNVQLAAKQWHSSLVTLHPPTELDLVESTTISDWLPSIESFQYHHFIKKFPQSEQQQFPTFTTEQILSKMNFDTWFSSTIILKNFVDKKFDKYFLKYIRYVCIFITLNGFTMQKTPHELMFGYQDEYLKKIKNNYPPFGGDPSTPSIIHFNDPNITTAEQSINEYVIMTGKKDYTQIAQYYEINGRKTLATNYTKFNGNQTYWQLENPWMEEDYFYGTNAKMFSPNMFDTNNISLYIPNVQRYGSGPLTQGWKTERFGVDVVINFIGESLFMSTQYSDFNKKYYQTYEAVFNVTSVVGLPLFSTKNHFMNCTKNWTTFVDIYNQDASILYKETSHWDDSFIILQPYSGASFQSTLFLQNNYYHEPDFLFDYNQTSLLPVFSIYRSGNLTEQKANQLFEPLLTALGIRQALLYVGIGFMTVCLLVLGFVSYKKYKLNKNKPKESSKIMKRSSLGFSLQPQQYLRQDKQDQKDKQKVAVDEVPAESNEASNADDS